MIKQAERISKLPPYLFARIEQKIAEAREKGVDIISLGIGDPDQPTPSYIVEELNTASRETANHQYPSSVGMLEYRKAVCQWYERQHGVTLDPKKEVVSLIGSKEGIGHISFCYVNPGDINLVPDPGYPVYGIGTILAGGTPYVMPLKEENGFLVDLDIIPEDVAQRAKLMFINYPNNPTGAVANREFFEKVVAFAKKYDIVVCHDAAYSEVFFDGQRPLSFMEIPGAKDVGIEFNSLSKPFNMTGWRIGWAVGRQEVIEALGRIKSNLDSGVFQAVQVAAIKALTGPLDCLEDMRKLYEHRRDMVIDKLNSMGWQLEKTIGSFYIWVPVPKGYSSAQFCELIFEKANVIITPGNGYGEYGEGYFRISLTVAENRLKEALERMKKVQW
ncbi:LL-diaminopimelate aminotransferase [Desulfitibacter alkalitolerans]|uniref:LL-diaminopimelate aminotransferase n=1 Tax=Desulfitibacter alkalitolerans TaxID=264641 RepID=UPI000555E765|nr:LL-diaminopimelate aminotransferase [Desulfitibacter alkalitolerans]